ncbi:MAG: YceI family protein [Pirellulaceae bacterium]
MKRLLCPWLMILAFAFIGCAPPASEDGDPSADAADSSTDASGADTGDTDSLPPENDGDPSPADDASPPPAADGDPAPAADGDPAPAADGDPAPPADGDPAPAADGDPPPAADGDPASAADGDPAPADSAAAGDTELSPANTKIQFVGVHTDPAKPDPRTGTFGKFSGKAALEGGVLKSVSVDIQTDSLSTEFEKLTNHLKSPDFFAVKQFPKATFKSTKIEDAGDGKVNITGDLTLLDATKSITIPATVSTEGGLKLNAKFTIDRTQFGMTFGEENVKKEVEMTVTVGK